MTNEDTRNRERREKYHEEKFGPKLYKNEIPDHVDTLHIAMIKHIVYVVKGCDWNFTKAAVKLDIDRMTLRRWMREAHEMGLALDDYKKELRDKQSVKLKEIWKNR